MTKPYLAAARAQSTGDFWALAGKGNLMVLAGQPASRPEPENFSVRRMTWRVKKICR